MKKFIEFNLVQQKTKTSIYAVRNIKTRYILGYIQWHNHWCQYCFYPEKDCFFSVGCLNDIISFIQTENKKRIEKVL